MKDGFKFFREDLCDLCGACFNACPYLDLSSGEAVGEIKCLMEGNNKLSLALRVCNTCHTCDAACPRDANPYELILERWGEDRKGSLPSTAGMVMPNREANLWASLRPLLTKEEAEMLDSWAERKRRESICLTGFYTNIVPYTMTGKIFELLPEIYGTEMLWGSGGDIYKTGRFDIVEAVVGRLEKVFRETGVKNVISAMGAEGMMLKEVLTERFGADFSFDVKPLDIWLLEHVKSGDIKIVEKQEMVVTVHDSCVCKLSGSELQNANRELLKYAGCKLVEMRDNREHSMCCGFGASAARFRLADIMESGLKRLRQAENTGAETVAVYCHACLFVLSMIAELANSRLKIMHITQIMEKAAGGRPNDLNESRARDVMAILSNHILKMALFPSYRKRFEPVMPDAEIEEPPILRDADRLRIKLFSVFLKSGIYRSSPVSSIKGKSFRLFVGIYSKWRAAQLKVVPLRRKSRMMLKKLV